MEKQSFFWTPSFKPCFSFVFLQYSIIKPFPHFFPGKKMQFQQLRGFAWAQVALRGKAVARNLWPSPYVQGLAWACERSWNLMKIDEVVDRFDGHTLARYEMPKPLE
jgi:hypothetical protein